RNGRFLTLGMSVGQRGFTDGMADIYDSDVAFGLYLSYFFDLRFAMQFGYLTGGHALKIAGNGQSITGDADISTVSVDFKYFINTQNVTKGLAATNPYLLLGFASVSREININGIADFSNDRASGFSVGGGVEFPIMRNKMYIGAQGLYQFVNFKDENTNLEVNGTATGKYPSGDMFLLTGVLGVNF
ncbi:MAG: outer membrane beta-barrel protein, partial [Bdellovibrionota bacterium]